MRMIGDHMLLDILSREPWFLALTQARCLALILDLGEECDAFAGVLYQCLSETSAVRTLIEQCAIPGGAGAASGNRDSLRRRAQRAKNQLDSALRDFEEGSYRYLPPSQASLALCDEATRSEWGRIEKRFVETLKPDATACLISLQDCIERCR